MAFPTLCELLNDSARRWPDRELFILPALHVDQMTLASCRKPM
jgi:hypothetical protein